MIVSQCFFLPDKLSIYVKQKNTTFVVLF